MFTPFLLPFLRAFAAENESILNWRLIARTILKQTCALNTTFHIARCIHSHTMYKQKYPIKCEYPVICCSYEQIHLYKSSIRGWQQSRRRVESAKKRGEQRKCTGKIRLSSMKLRWFYVILCVALFRPLNSLKTH